jgi:hypothetical protein
MRVMFEAHAHGRVMIAQVLARLFRILTFANRTRALSVKI